VLTLPSELQKAVAAEGTPLPLLNAKTGEPYLLLSVDMSPAPLDGVQASLRGLPIYGEGETPEDAVLALAIMLKSLQGQADS
jgi:hypothetical protein